MRRHIQSAFLSLTTLCTTALCCLAEEQVVGSEYIVQRTALRGASLSAGLAYTVLNSSDWIDVVQPRTAGARQSANQPVKILPYDAVTAALDCNEILKDPSIASCEPNFVKRNGDSFPNDPLFYPNPGASFLGQFAHFSSFADGFTTFDMRSPMAWDFVIGSDSTVIGVIDSGINYIHPDLQPNLWQNPGEVPGNGIDEDGNGYIDDMIGIDANNRTNDPFDCNGHGSHVSGIIGARGNNGIGIAGVAWRTKIIMARNAIDCGDSVSTAAVIRGLEYFYDLKKNRGINVAAINASYSGGAFTQAEYAAMDRLRDVNIVFVAAAGNNGVNIDLDPRYPAAYDLDNIVSVANIDTSTAPNSLNTSSNFGINSVDIGAPGTEIYSTIEPNSFNSETYGFKTGTSMAAPAVTGAFALLGAQRPQMIGYKMRISHLYNTAYPISILSGRVKTGATLNLLALVTTADPADQCPTDPAKLEPGFCGCGAPEVYLDNDGDRTPNCADQCPNDQGKTSPGACGCGAADGDLNGNSVQDCVDAGLQNEKPVAAKLTFKKGKPQIELTPRPGVLYIVEISTRAPGATKFKKTTLKTMNVLLKRPKLVRGTTITVTYSFHIPGALNPFTSQKSQTVRKTVR